LIIPIRCFTCGKLIGDKWEEYQQRVAKGEEPAKILDSFELDRYCCRRMLISHVELIDDLLKYSIIADERRKEMGV
jgi:DNA-directed RNA polymerase subunit N